MAPKRNKQSKIYKQRQNEMKRKSNPYGDSQTMHLDQQITRKYRVEIKDSIQGMVNKLLSNGDHDQPTVAPNSTSDTMVGTSTHLGFKLSHFEEYFQIDSTPNVLDNARPSRDSSASMVNDERLSKIDLVNQKTSS